MTGFVSAVLQHPACSTGPFDRLREFRTNAWSSWAVIDFLFSVPRSDTGRLKTASSAVLTVAEPWFPRACQLGGGVRVLVSTPLASRTSSTVMSRLFSLPCSRDKRYRARFVAATSAAGITQVSRIHLSVLSLTPISVRIVRRHLQGPETWRIRRCRHASFHFGKAVGTVGKPGRHSATCMAGIVVVLSYAAGRCDCPCFPSAFSRSNASAG
jgi:hypothetical protein